MNPVSLSGGITLALVAGAMLLPINSASGHGFVGKRFFPATLAVDDPLVSDELALPTIGSRRVPADDGGTVRETTYSLDFGKRITDNFGIEFSATYLDLKPDEGDRQRGWDNIGVGAKYEFYKNNEHETVLSAGIDWDIANTGSKRVGAESFHTFTPALFFGKGFGDLGPESKWLRPLAVTGMVGVGIPSRASTTTINDDGDEETERHPHTLEWGLTFQYNLLYLNTNVQDMGWSTPFNRMIPIVELPMSTALDRGESGTTGTANPGVLWIGKYVQLGVEAVIPINNRSGSHVGWLAQIHWFIDDMFPQLGRPMVHP